MADPDYYALLGVAHDASAAQIRAAWRRLARAHHPDLNTEPSDLAKFKAAQEAYSTLSSVERRRAYDDSLVSPGPAFASMEDIFTSFFDTSAFAPPATL